MNRLGWHEKHFSDLVFRIGKPLKSHKNEARVVVIREDINALSALENIYVGFVDDYERLLVAKWFQSESRIQWVETRDRRSVCHCVDEKEHVVQSVGRFAGSFDEVAKLFGSLYQVDVVQHSGACNQHCKLRVHVFELFQVVGVRCFDHQSEKPDEKFVSFV